MKSSRSMAASEMVLNRHITLEDAVTIIEGRAVLALHPDAVARCAKAHVRLQNVIAQDRLVYGLTTGFGPLANRLINARHGADLQQNLVFHLATGVGPAFDWATGRAMVLARLLSIVQGASGASEKAIAALIALLNSTLSPVIPSKGTVGASGDLTPLAHMVLCFQGAGDFQDRKGEIIAGTKALEILNIDPLSLERRDGLALVNGTSAMTGIAVLNADLAGKAIAWSLALTAMLAEVMFGRAEAWDPVFAELRPHPRQADAARVLSSRISGSEWITWGYLASRRIPDIAHMTETEAGQDAYTLRCAPQVIGAVWDLVDWHDRVVQTELNAVTDNPVFPANDDKASVMHGGNFMGQHVGLASDALANGTCVLAGLAERQVARVTDEKLNRGLPAFLHQGDAGLHSGLMGAQVTATALLAEMRSIGPASIHSISTNGANQDVVSMGTIAARHAREKLNTLVQIQAVLALAVAQAIDLRRVSDPRRAFSLQTVAVQKLIRSISPEITQDRSLGQDIEAMAQYMATATPPN